MLIMNALLLILAIVCAIQTQALGEVTTNCSLSRRQLDLEPCLSGIRSLVNNNEVYWFGTSFSDWCPNGPALQPSGCRLPEGLSIPQSISSLTFTPETYIPGDLDRYLDVTYISPPGSYWGCGNENRFEQTTRYEADPLSLAPVDSWLVRNEPQFSWENSPDTYYTLIMKDVGYNYLHAIYVNIPGDDVSRGRALFPYVGPGSPHRFGNVYVFLLFKQTGVMTLDARYANISGPQALNISQFAQVQDLTGPIAMNWIMAKGDLYAVERIRNRCCVNNCANFIGPAIPTQPFIPHNPHFTVFVNVTYLSEAIDFKACCSHYHHDATNKSLNPLGNGVLKAVYARSMPKVEFNPSIVFFNPETGFEDTLYTLAMVDPDTPFAEVGTNARPLLHWLVINIQNGRVNLGEHVVRYMLASPPDTPAHTYYFLLYEQNSKIEDSQSFMEYIGRSCWDGIEDRCLFNVSGFASSNNMRLVGASWMMVYRDEYVRYSRISHGESEEELCKEEDGYKKVCEHLTAGVQTLAISAILALGACICALGKAMLLY